VEPPEEARAIAAALSLAGALDLPADHAVVLQSSNLHAAMRTVDIPTPHFTDRVTEAEQIVGHAELSPGLTGADRELLAHALQGPRRAIRDRGAPEQLLHGEPHPGNVLATVDGPGSSTSRRAAGDPLPPG
jgi:hypothetical protein